MVGGLRAFRVKVGEDAPGFHRVGCWWLEEIKKLKKGNEMLSLVGFGIFAKTGLLDNEKVLINVGSNVVCKKSIDEARKLIEKKLEQALSIYSQLFSEIERINEAIQKIESELSKSK